MPGCVSEHLLFGWTCLCLCLRLQNTSKAVNQHPRCSQMPAEDAAPEPASPGSKAFGSSNTQPSPGVLPSWTMQLFVSVRNFLLRVILPYLCSLWLVTPVLYGGPEQAALPYFLSMNPRRNYLRSPFCQVLLSWLSGSPLRASLSQLPPSVSMFFFRNYLSSSLFGNNPFLCLS